MKALVSISNDMATCLWLVMPHSRTLPGLPVSGEIPTPMFWPPGMANNQNKLTSRVLHKGLPICQDDHDIGVGVVHAHIPVDPLDAIAALNSSRKIVFGGSRIKAQKKPLGAASLHDTEPKPMLNCADPISLPLAGAVTSSMNTVTFGITLDDLLLGGMHMVSDMLIDCIGAIAGAGNELLGYAAKTIAKNVKSLAVATYKAVTTDGEVEIKVTLGCPFLTDLLSLSGGFVRDGAGNWKSEWGGHIFDKDGRIEVDFDRPEVIDIKAEDRDGFVNIDVMRDDEKVTYNSGVGGHGAVTKEDKP